MCGIVGYVGDNFAQIVVVDGLKRLEYRGYDSAGLAVPLDGGLKLLRRVGKIVNLEREVLREPLQAHVGIGHTRWATHGAPTEANTHPHTDAAGHIAVVHNGIIENYLELRHELEAAGHHFTSATDTEVVPHLVAAGLARGLDLVEAFRAALRRLEGSYALGLVSAKHPDVILGARRSSPLVVGYGEKEFLLASDVFAIQSYAEAVSYLEDGDVCVIDASGIRLSDLEGRHVERPRHKVDRESLPVRREGYGNSMPRRSTSSRACSPRPSRAGSPTAAATWCSTASASRATRCASSSTSRSWPAGRHGTRGSLAATSSKDWRASPVAWTMDQNSEGAPRCCPSAPSFSPSRSLARRLTP